MLEELLRGTEEVIVKEDFEELLKQKKTLRVKFGADPTSPDLHFGHLVILKKLRKFQEYGHKVIFIIGDYTARIGDPSGRNATRPPLTKEEVAENARTYQKQIFKVLIKEKTEIVYNSQWFDNFNFDKILKISSLYTVARMLERDDFQKRYTNNEPIRIHEFLYPLMQGYDSVEVEADIELGGNDQKFNLLVGRDFQKEYGQKQQIIMTLPLLVGTDGVKKMSKSYNNYIAFDDTADEMFGKILSVSDILMWDYYKLLSNKPLKWIEEQKQLVKDNKINPKNLKSELAKELIGFFYDETAANKAEENFNKVFKKKEIPDDIEELLIKEQELNIIDLIEKTGLLSSRSESKRLIRQNAVSINSQKVADDKQIIKIEDEIILKIGKRKFKKIILQK